MENDITLINLSLGTLRTDAIHPLYLACEKACQQGIIVVASKNNAINSWGYPSIFENVIGVERGNFEDPYDFIYRPDNAIECEAKGKFDQLLWLKGKKISSEGNSFASPIITGIIALILERFPAFPISRIRELLFEFSIPQSGHNV